MSLADARPTDSVQHLLYLIAKAIASGEVSVACNTAAFNGMTLDESEQQLLFRIAKALQPA